MSSTRSSGALLLAASLVTTGVFSFSTTDAPVGVPVERGPTASAGETVARVDLAQAVAIALKAHPGRAVAVELEAEDDVDYLVWEIDVLSRGRIVEVEVRADKGEIVEAEAEDDEDGEVARYRTLLPHCEKSLVEMVEASLKIVHGRAIGAELEIDDGQPVCEVLVANGRYRIEVAIEARAGHMLELEYENPLWEGDDDEEDEEWEWEEEQEEEEEDEEHDHERRESRERVHREHGEHEHSDRRRDGERG